MAPSFGQILTSERIAALDDRIRTTVDTGGHEAASPAVQELRAVQQHQPEVASALLRLVRDGCLSPVDAVPLLGEIKDAHADDTNVFALMGDAIEGLSDLDDLNRPAPADPVICEIVDRLTLLAENCQVTDREKALLTALSTAARIVGRQRDGIAEASYRKLVAMEPERSSAHYNLGLFFKTRGRFAEGLAANQKAAALSDEPVECYEWNTAICATGAGDGEAALDVWKRMDQKIELGRFGLPEGPYPMTKVRLAERPLAERDADCDDPGLEETIWIERLSPCHGIIRSVLYSDLGVDYGDVVLIDGAPITYHKYGDEEVPVFPHLATLKRQGYQFFDFAGTQDEAGRIADISSDLPGDAIVYSHSENYREICRACWRDPDVDHERHEVMEKHVVTGRLAAPKEIDPMDLLVRLDSAIGDRAPCRLYSPDLAVAAGDIERSEVERGRFQMLAGR